MEYQHLEAVCARYGSEIVQRKGGDKEAGRLGTIIRNALGVLREDGVFAFYLFLRYRWEDGGKVIWPQLKALWQNDAIGPLLTGAGSDRDQVIALTDDLQALLLARDVAERTLVYALYGLRAKG
ncbi:MAG TPA: hypothetical protein PLQ85_03955 [Anaerolineae bacterium]|nr:hypothetical protein [Anaerolineae bacterium]HQE99788.1 hypothetical protein [Anaerolineae bacterium]HQJ11869.1 hypothetical protein [Anaerolineae bacterium]HUM36006.1 hypothetical protein [Anaerolineae bacterium]